LGYWVVKPGNKNPPNDAPGGSLVYTESRRLVGSVADVNPLPAPAVWRHDTPQANAAVIPVTAGIVAIRDTVKAPSGSEAAPEPTVKAVTGETPACEAMACEASAPETVTASEAMTPAATSSEGHGFGRDESHAHGNGCGQRDDSFAKHRLSFLSSGCNARPIDAFRSGCLLASEPPLLS
jgi:phage-related tail fiber protein